MNAPDEFVTYDYCEEKHGNNSRWIKVATGLMAVFVVIAGMSVAAGLRAVDVTGNVSGEMKTHIGVQAEKDRHVIETLDRIEATQVADHLAIEKILRTVNGVP